MTLMYDPVIMNRFQSIIYIAVFFSAPTLATLQTDMQQCGQLLGLNQCSSNGACVFSSFDHAMNSQFIELFGSRDAAAKFLDLFDSSSGANDNDGESAVGIHVIREYLAGGSCMAQLTDAHCAELGSADECNGYDGHLIVGQSCEWNESCRKK